MSDRQTTAQHTPAPGAVDGFPTHPMARGTVVHRAHLAARGPWWHSSDGGGRFDLPAPAGTCYLATTALVALRERLGPVLGARDNVPATLLDGVVVSRLLTPRAAVLANLRVTRAARHGVTRELEVMTPYAVPQAWARAFADHGLGGVRYGPRFTPGTASSLAVFGPAGEDTAAAVDPSPTPAAEVPGAPAAVAPPRRHEVTVVRPPRTRPR